MDIISIIERLGPCSSADAIASLTASGRYSNTAARKQLSRALRKGSKIYYLNHVHLKSNGRVWYTNDQKSQDDWIAKLSQVCLKSGSSYCHVLHHLLLAGGAIEKNRLASLCGFPIKPRKKHILWQTALENLVSDHIVAEVEGYEDGKYIALVPHTLGHDVAHAKYRTEQALICIIKDYLRKNGFVSYGQIRCGLCKEDSEFGGYGWDLTAPTYISPYASFQAGGKTSPGFWVIDCIIGRKLSKTDIACFLSKITALRSLKNCRPFTPLLIANGFEVDALRQGRAAGAVLTTPAQLLGEEAAKALALLLEVLSNPGAVAIKSPNKVATLGLELAKIEGVMGNLRGDLFELLSGVALLAEFGGNISMKRSVRTGTDIVTDIDVEIITSSAVYVVQCKGSLSDKMIDVDEVRDWYRNKVHLIRDYRAGAYEERRQHHCFWTSGSFTPDAIAFLDRHSASCKKYDVAWKDGPAMKQYLRQMNQNNLVPVLERISCDANQSVDKISSVSPA
jgi:hypothetical protein